MRILPILSLAVAAFALAPSDAAAQGWAAVDVGFQHACGLDDQGRAYCWGPNDVGQLGAPTPQRCFRAHHGPGKRCVPRPSAAPIAVAGGHRFRAIRAGHSATCGVDLEDRLLCWGFQYGREPEPAPYAPAHRFRDVRDTEMTVCGALAEGGGRCWEYEEEWEEAAFLPDEPLVAVDAAAYPDGVVCAVTADGRALCRGDNKYGQLGTGSVEEREGWGEVAGGRRWAELRTAESWVCGRATDGEVFCWGAYVGDEAVCSMGYPCAPAPRPIAPGVRFRALDRGREEMCGLTEDGRMLCWDHGGTVRKTAVETRFLTIAGGYNGWCGVTQDGKLRCWGWQEGPAEPAPVPPPASADGNEDHDHGAR